MNLIAIALNTRFWLPLIKNLSLDPKLQRLEGQSLNQDPWLFLIINILLDRDYNEATSEVIRAAAPLTKAVAIEVPTKSGIPAINSQRGYFCSGGY